MYALEYLAHYFYPRHSNNHKAKMLHKSTLVLMTFILVSFQVLFTAMPKVGIRILGYAANISSTEVIRLANVQRSEAGLSALTYNSALEEAARAKGQHMLEQGYWSHVAPDGTEPWIFFTNAGYTYRYAGENLARDFSNPQSAIDAWMASPSHKENLLSSKYSEIGVAVVEGDLDGVDTTIIVQLFGAPLVSTESQVPIAHAKSDDVSTAAPAGASTESTDVNTTDIQTSPQPEASEEQIVALSEPVEDEPSKWELLISPFDTTKKVSTLLVGSLLVVMAVDGVVISRKKVSRIGGRTFAHMAFLGMILALVLIARAGEIL